MSLTKNEIKFLRSLQQKKFREEHQLFIVEGVKMVEELFTQTKFKPSHLYYTQDYDGLLPKNINSTLISNTDLQRISNLKSPNKILATVHLSAAIRPEYSSLDFVLILDNINDPGNLGTILRTADWFGVETIIVSENTVELFNPKVIQSSMGAVFRINYLQCDLLKELDLLKESGFNLCGATLAGKSIYQFEFPKKSALIMGSESHGISENVIRLIDEEILIPRFGKSESLNVGIATGIFLAEWRRSF